MSETPLLSEARYMVLRLKNFTTDGRFNRPVSTPTVNRMVSEWHHRAFSPIEAWQDPQRRDDEPYVILDGQHRIEAARKVGTAEDVKIIPAMIHFGLTVSDAAELFVVLNANKLVSAFDKYRALLCAGHLKTLDIDRIVHAQELAVGRSGKSAGRISCVDALRFVYDMSEPPGRILAKALRTLHTTWGESPDAYRSAILRGVALYFHEHHEVEPDQLSAALARKVTGGSMTLVSRADEIAGRRRMTLDRAIAEVIATQVMKPPRPRKVASA